MTLESTAVKSFPSAKDLSVPAGAEGWESLYPYYLSFREGDGSDAKFWFCDSQHWPTVFKPFETIGGEFAVKCLGQYNTRHLIIPPRKRHRVQGAPGLPLHESRCRRPGGDRCSRARI